MLAPYSTFPNDATGYQKFLGKGIMTYLSPEALNSLKSKEVKPIFDKYLVSIKFKKLKKRYIFTWNHNARMYVPEKWI
jgi:hypothetical protein